MPHAAFSPSAGSVADPHRSNVAPSVRPFMPSVSTTAAWTKPCPSRIPTNADAATATVTAGDTPSGRPPDFVLVAAPVLRRLTAGCAGPVPTRNVSPTGHVQPVAGPRASLATATPKKPAPPSASATAAAPKQGLSRDFASSAAGPSPSRASGCADPVVSNAAGTKRPGTRRQGTRESSTDYLELQISRIIQSGVLSRVTCQKRLCHAVFGHIDLGFVWIVFAGLASFSI